MNDHEYIHDEDLMAPRGLVNDLRALYGEMQEVPTTVDESIRHAAWRHFAVHRRVKTVRWLVPLAAAAAAVMVLIPLARPGIPGDVDGNRSVDILDAFALARRVDASQSMKTRWDMNHDHQVDQSDIDLIAAVAVALR